MIVVFVVLVDPYPHAVINFGIFGQTVPPNICPRGVFLQGGILLLPGLSVFSSSGCTLRGHETVWVTAGGGMFCCPCSYHGVSKVMIRVIEMVCVDIFFVPVTHVFWDWPDSVAFYAHAAGAFRCIPPCAAHCMKRLTGALPRDVCNY